MIVTRNVPISSVAMSNMPRRGNQPGATSCERSISVRNWIAWPETVMMMNAVMTTDTRAQAMRIAADRRLPRADASGRR